MIGVAAFRVAACAVALVFFEWLFFVTKPSFLDGAAPLSRLAALPVASGPFVALALLVHGALALLGKGAQRLFGLPSDHLALRIQGSLVASLLLTLLALLLVDNFTYTVFSWGIVSTEGLLPAIYCIGVFFVFLFILRRQLRAPPRLPAPWRRRTMGAWALCFLFGCGWLVFAEYESFEEIALPSRNKEGPLPNIILFSPDGLEADRISAFGYERETTPHLDRLLERGWVFTNAYTNSAKTAGSLTSMATGRYPTTTKVLFPPHRLRGTDAYRTLPRILRVLGYKNIQATVRYYVDGPELGWKDAFHSANLRVLPDRMSRWPVLDIIFDLPVSLTRAIAARLGERLGHLFSLRRMVRVHHEVVLPDTPSVETMTDDERLESVLGFIAQGNRPFFAQIHMMDTHCCQFRPKEPYFSRGMVERSQEKREAGLDDAIRETDQRFAKLISFLEENELLANTLVIFTSDHTYGWSFNRRLPLVFFFPDREKVGEVHRPAQMIDLAPTILDYLGIEPPSWMEGRSLFRELPEDRPIFSAAMIPQRRFLSKDWVRFFVAAETGPPTYGLKKIGLVVCQRWHSLDLVTGEYEEGEMPGHPAPCPADKLLSPGAARARMEAHLLERGFGLPPVDPLRDPALAAEPTP